MGERGEDLHNHQINKIDTRSLIQLARHEIRIQPIRQRTILEPQIIKPNAVTFQIPICHRERSQRLHHTNEPIRLKNKLPIHQTVFLSLARFAKHDVCFGGFIGENGGSSAVGEAADDDHKEGGEDLREAEDHVCHDGPEFGEGAGGEEVGDRFLEVVEDDAAVLDSFDDGGEGF